MTMTYRIGCRDALYHLGFKKVAETEEGISPMQGAAMTAAAGLPFLGLVGQKPIIHDPLQGAQGNRFRSMQELAAAARPGDVLVTSKPGGSMWKSFIAPLGGTEFYHAQPVIARRNGRGTTVSAGELSGADFQDMAPRQLKAELDTIPAAMNHYKYTDAVLLRPKAMDKAQKLDMASKSLDRSLRPYDSTKAIGTWLKELFLPKIEGLTDKGVPIKCQGNVCSSMPAMAAYEAAGHNVVPGKRPQDIFPTDFMRSENYDLVGSRLSGKLGPEYSMLRKLRPYALRGALGLGLAGGAYATTEEPSTAAVPIGAVGGYYGGNKLIEKFHPDLKNLSQVLREEAAAEKLPSALTALDALLDSGTKGKGQILKRFGLRTVPLVAGGAALGYLGAKGIEHLMQSKS